jgi:hypothetical protein
VARGEKIFVNDYTDYLNENSRPLWLQKNEGGVPYSFMVKVYENLTKENSHHAQANMTTFLEKNKVLTPYLEFVSLRIMQSLVGIKYNQATAKTLSNLDNLKVNPLIKRGGNISVWLRRHQKLYQIVKYFKN